MLSVALAGKPNAGKSTFYKAATQADVEVGNYPFTTIDANRGVSYVRTRCPCLDRDRRCNNCEAGKRYVPVELIDVAGLVPGAHAGRGLGNQFLDALSNADAILNVVDASGGTDAEGEPVPDGSYDPVQDVTFVAEELDLWLAGIVGRNWERLERQSRAPDFEMEAALAELLTGVGADRAAVTATLRAIEYPTDPKQWTDDDRERLARELRSRTKPIVVVANKVDAADPATVDRLREAAERMVPASAESELALRQAAKQGVITYDPGDGAFEVTGEVTAAQTDGLDRIRAVIQAHEGTGVQRALNVAVYDLLDQVTAYPVENETDWTDGQGEMPPDAHLLDRGATPRDLAYTVHSDIGEGYLHAVDARSGRRIGEDRVLEEGDVIKIVSTTT